MKTISCNEAIQMCKRWPTHRIILDKVGECNIHRVDEPFILIQVETGTNGSESPAGDYIALHPNGYPFVVSYEVARRARHVW
jgi:hypothetical protein